MRLVESDIAKDCAGHDVCLVSNCSNHSVDRDVIYDYMVEVEGNINRGVWFEVRDLLSSKSHDGGKVLFHVTDCHFSEIHKDGSFKIFGEFMDISGEKPHRTDYTRRLESIANNGRYYIDIILSDGFGNMKVRIKDISVVMNPFIFAPYIVTQTGHLV